MHLDASPNQATPASISEEHFRSVADCTYDWESWHGPDGCLMWVNPAVERATGWSVGECHALSDYPLPLVLPDRAPGETRGRP